MTWHFSAGGFWVRITKRGWGVDVLHRRDRPLFSERNGYRRYWPKWPARYRVGILTPLGRGK